MFLTSDCVKGILHSNWYHTQEIYSQAYFSGKSRDNHFIGSFCPPSSGKYRLIYEGSIDSKNEAKYSNYIFNEKSSKSRTSEYNYLYRKTCYSYAMYHSYFTGYFTGALYFQKDSEERQLITNMTSYTCNRKICLSGSRDPQCGFNNTLKIRMNRSNSKIHLI